MDKKAWIIFGVIVVTVLGGLIYMSGKNKIDVSNVNEKVVLGASEANGNTADHVFGKKDSKVVLIEYGDFQCPGCGKAHPIVKELTEKYKGQIAFVFRNFPLTTIHPNAKAAAAAVEAAGLQGKYWEYHNALYENQDAWSSLDAAERTDYFIDTAKTTGVKDIEKFKQDIESSDVKQKINFDIALGKKVGVTGTPSIYLNGTAISDKTWTDQAKFEEALKAEMKKQGIEVPAEQTEAKAQE
jgi:protein-disulfide isomerase